MIMPSRARLVSVPFLFAMVIPIMAQAQGAAIVRPSVVAKSSHSLQIDPSLAGFRLGEKTAKALALLGAPLTTEKVNEGPDAIISYTNDKTGITILATKLEGVGIILVTSRDAGALDTVRVGDTHESVVARWGPPAAGDASEALWLAGKYVITVKFDDKGHVSRLGIGYGMHVAT